MERRKRLEKEWSPKNSKKLSEYWQDPYTYRYGYAYIPGKNTEEIEEKNDKIKKSLNFVFKE